MDCLDKALATLTFLNSSPPSPASRVPNGALRWRKAYGQAIAEQNYASYDGRKLLSAMGFRTDTSTTSSSSPPSSSSSSSSSSSAAAAASTKASSADMDPQYPAAVLSSSVVSFYRNAHKFSTAHEALDALIAGQMSPRPDDKELALRKVLRERRKIVQELVIESLKAKKMGPTFSKSVASNMAEFVDHVMIEAAALKKIPEHANTHFSFRARLYIEQIGVAQVVKWLKHHKFTAPRIGKLVYMVEDYEGNLQPKITWLKRINVQGRDLGVALTREPRILERTLKELNGSVDLLQKHGIRKDWVGWVVRRSPKVLACEEQELLERITFYTRLGIKPDDLGKMAYNFPACLGHFTLDDMYSKADYLKEFGLDDNTLGKILSRKPQLIACSIEDDWKPLVKFLYYLGLDGNGVRRILTSQPSVFCLNLAENIAPKIRFLRDIGVYEEAIGDVLVRFPAFLSFSLDKKIRPLVRFLLEEAGVPVDQLGKVVCLQPDLVGCSLSNKVQMVVRFFRYHRIPKEKIGAMVVDFPLLLKYSISIIKPKFRYFVKVMARPMDDIVHFPRFFSYSLDLRIAPRHTMLIEKGCHMQLRTMLACSDEEFLSRLEGCCRKSDSVNTEDESNDMWDGNLEGE